MKIEQSAAQTSYHGQGFNIPTAKLGLWLLLAAATMLFAMLLSAYLVHMGLSSDGQPLAQLPILWLNTLLLLASSGALEWARRVAQDYAKALRFWLVGGGLAVFFVLGQLIAWQQLADAGYFLAATVASSFFYLLTALHGLHLLGGLIMWLRTAIRMRETAHRQSIELCTLYWHFLLLVWLITLGLIWLY